MNQPVIMYPRKGVLDKVLKQIHKHPNFVHSNKKKNYLFNFLIKILKTLIRNSYMCIIVN